MFDYCEEESLIKASSIFSPIENFPQIMLATWQQGFLNSILSSDEIQLGELKNKTRYGLKELTFCGKRLGFCVIPIGSPFVAQFIDEMMVMGTKKFVFVGSCGMLDNTDAEIIVPDKAYRDEGTSWHYVPDKEEFFNIENADKVCSVLDSLSIPYTKGPVWTTDAFYRETPSAVSYYKNKGCIAVDMECSAIAALSKYCKAETYQFFFTADSLKDKNWKIKRLLKMAKTAWDAYLQIALEICMRI